MKKLSDKKCIPCEDNSIQPFSCDQAHELFDEYRGELTGWIMDDGCKKITLDRTFPNFVHAMEFVNHVADSAESVGHHPDISIWYNRVELTLFTHSLQGLSENDFILAAKINTLL